MSQRPPPALRLLSLDGGGIRGISELVILDEIMHRVQRVQNLPNVPLPADYFDLICGTSTGGLIALLLGRLRFSVPEAIDKYRLLAKTVFSDKKSLGKDGKFKASNLEKAIKDVVEGKLGPGRAEERMFLSDVGACKTFVCAVPALHLNKRPRLFRTWLADRNPGYNCTIWEAARATSAAPTFFKRIRIGEAGLQEDFVDAGVGCNNPVQYLIQEAEREFGPEREVACIVSIGTGRLKVPGFTAPGLFQRLLPLSLIKVLANMATDSEAEAAAMEVRYQNCPGLYYRLNVERGLEEISLEEWEKLGEVKAHTMEYLEADEISKSIDVIVDALVGTPAQSFPLGHLGGSVQTVPLTRNFFIYPSYRVSHFIERKFPIDEISRQFNVSDNAAMPTVFVLIGMGGCGKSQLALEYCYQSEKNRTYSVIFWIDATSPATAYQSFAATAQALSKPAFNITDNEGNVEFVRNEMSKWQGKWLFVFDNFDEPKLFNDKTIKDYFPRRGRGSILITSRAIEAQNLGHHHLNISIMSNDEALELLFRRSQADKTEANVREGEAITTRLGFHALAIDQAGAYILARNLDLGLYLTHYNLRREKVLSETPDLWDYKRAIKDSPETITKLTVFTTWELSFDLITGNGTSRQEKEHILTLISFFDGKEISDELFSPYGLGNKEWMTSCVENDAWSVFKFQDILMELHNLSLLQSLRIQSLRASFSLHPLIQDWIKLRIGLESRRSYAIEAIMVLGVFLEKRDFNMISFDAKQIVLAHLEAVLSNQEENLSQDAYLKNIAVVDAMVVLSSFLQIHGRYKKAEMLSLLALDGRKRLLGKEHPGTLQSINNLAIVLMSRGKHEEAEPIYRQALALEEKILGKEHPSTLTSMSNLASILHNRGKYVEAERIYHQTLALREKILGKEHPSTLTSMSNLASILHNRGKYVEAERIYHQTLALREKILGKEHPSTLTSMSNLASLLKDRGKHEEAEPICRQTLALREKILGKEHPSTLTSMSNLASLLKDRGKHEEAEPICCQTLALMESILGKEHPDTLKSMNNLASLLKDRGKHEEAEPICCQTLALMESILGKEHPDTLTSMNNLASILQEQGKYEEAESIFRQTLALREKILGKEHPSTLTSMSNLASILHNRGKYVEAERIYHQTLALMENILGKEHLDTLTSMNSLAVLLYKQGRYAEAELLVRQTLALREKVLGQEHPETLNSKVGLALVLEKCVQCGETESLV